jgi:hypothetical protein
VNASTPNIWLLQARQDVAGLIEALTDADKDIRKRAATALRILDAAEALPALEAALVIEEDWQAQANISAAIQHLQREERLEDLIVQENVPGLIGMLHSADPGEVIGAARALGHIGDTKAAEALIKLFRAADTPDDVRFVLAESLIQLNSAPAAVSLLAGLEREEWQVRRNAVAVLAQLNATWAAPAIAGRLYDANPMVARTAEAALKRLDTPAAHEALAEWRRAQAQATVKPAAPPPPDPPVEVIDDTADEDAESVNAAQPVEPPTAGEESADVSAAPTDSPPPEESAASMVERVNAAVTAQTADTPPESDALPTNTSPTIPSRPTEPLRPADLDAALTDTGSKSDPPAASETAEVPATD